MTRLACRSFQFKFYAYSPFSAVACAPYTSYPDMYESFLKTTFWHLAFGESGETKRAVCMLF